MEHGHIVPDLMAIGLDPEAVQQDRILARKRLNTDNEKKNALHVRSLLHNERRTAACDR